MTAAQSQTVASVAWRALRRGLTYRNGVRIQQLSPLSCPQWRQERETSTSISSNGQRAEVASLDCRSRSSSLRSPSSAAFGRLRRRNHGIYPGKPECHRSYATLVPIQKQDPALYATLRPVSFSIIAHIDHGKSTLADRLLELTGTIPIGPDGQMINRQVLDSLKVERERGITVKSQAVSMVYDDAASGQKWLLNLIDTPGHVDFAYEVSRSLSACQIALLVVDATQGIQSQTLSVFRVAKERGLHIIPVINKVDLPGAAPEVVIEQLSTRLGLDVSEGSLEEAVQISAKTGLNVPDVLQQIVKVGKAIDTGLARGQDEKMRALVFDSWYDPYKGVVALVSLKDGALRKGDKISSAHARKRYDALDVGVNSPTAVSTGILKKGQVGWVIMNMKDVLEASIGDTLHHANTSIEALPGFKPSLPMIFSSAYPLNTSDFPKLEAAVQKLALNDRSVTCSRETSNALGQGVKLGLLGALHLEIFRSRLADEYGMEVLVTNPTVAYRVVHHNQKRDDAKVITNPLEFPEEALRSRARGLSHVEEPMVIGTLTCPEEFVGSMIQLCAERRGEEIDFEFQEGFDAASPDEAGRGTERLAILKYRLPLSEIVTDFFGEVKSRTAGFATFDYEDAGWQQSDLVRVSFILTGSPIDALTQIVHRSKGIETARAWVNRLREVVPRQQYEVIIQGVVSGKIVASERKSAFRKDVTAGVGGGHQERKLKHLNKQKEGKKRLREMSFGRVQIPQEGFLQLFEQKKTA